MPPQLLKALPSRKTKNRLWLIFSDHSKLPLLVDDFIRLHLRPGEISTDIWAKIQTLSLTHLLRQYAFNQIALSPKIDLVLAPKIKQKLFFYQKKYQITGDYSFLVDELIDHLNSQNLLDKNSFAEHLLRKNRGRSARYLALLFAHYHLSLPSSPDSDQEKLRLLLKSRKYASLNLSESSVKNKLIASLQRKGFAYHDIKTVIDETFKKS